MRVAGAVVVFVFAGMGAWAQEPAVCVPRLFPSSLILNAPSRGASRATIKTIFEQRLFDGNVISTASVAHIYQNAEGWIRMDYQTGCVQDVDGTLQHQIQVTVNKPNLYERLGWPEGPSVSKRAFRSRVPPQIAERGQRLDPRAASRTPWPTSDPHVKVEQLGSAIIASQAATGRRDTFTYAPGEDGNARPLVMVWEVWSTKDGYRMRVISDDPRSGKTVSEITELIAEEPDAALFAPPADYVLTESKSTAPSTTVR